MSYKRSRFLINKNFQLRFAFYVCSWLIALSFAYPLIISNLFDYFLRYLALDPSGPALSQLEQTRIEILKLLVVMQVIFLSLTFLISLFMSHKIAGPLFKLSKFFKEAKEGNITQKLAFRKSDYFQEITHDYNEMMDSIRLQMETNEKKLIETQSNLEKTLKQTNPDFRTQIETILTNLKS